MYWDILRLFFEIKAGISKAVNMGGFDAIGIDTWGVDFGLIDKKGNLISNPVHYRDTRTETIPQEVYKIISKDEIYKRTGIQFMRFNTLYQLMYLKLKEPDVLEKADKMLFIPDLFAYFLTGEIHAEATIASTSNLLNPESHDWDFGLIEKLDLPRSIFPEIISPGKVYGLLSDAICEELGCDKVPVIAVASHDTASAVAATPSVTNDFAYISCGTWSLFGIESEKPIVNDSAAKLNFTNEGGFCDTIRFLKNIMGLWLIQESRRRWKLEGKDVSFDYLEKEALACEPFKCFIDVDNPMFETAGNLPQRVKEFCRSTNQFVPESIGEIMRCIYESLAMKYKYTLCCLEELSERKYNKINMLGGGIKDTLLCQMTANACNVTVSAGPTEATVIGNIAVVFSALGEIKDFKTLRQVVTDSTELKFYTPQNTALWETAYEEYLKILKK